MPAVEHRHVEPGLQVQTMMQVAQQYREVPLALLVATRRSDRLSQAFPSQVTSVSASVVRGRLPA